jgi:hypothetical protein
VKSQVSRRRAGLDPGGVFRNDPRWALTDLSRRVRELCRGAKQRKRIFDKQPFAAKGVLVWRGLECYTFEYQPIDEWISFEDSMSRPSPSRSPSRTHTGSRGRVALRWHLGNSSTKVLFGLPASPSTLVPHAAAPASPAIFTGRQLSLRARNLQIGDVTI